MPSYDPFEEGDALTAANLNSRFTTMATWVNDLPASSVARWALRREHLPSQTFGQGQSTEYFANGFTAAGSAQTGESAPGIANVAGDHDTSLPYSVGPAHPVTYQTFSVTGGSAPYGPASATDGWRIPAQTGGTVPMEIDLGATRADIGTTFGTDGGILVRAHLEAYEAKGGRAANANNHNEERSRCIVFGIGFEDGLGARYVVERSVRWNTIRGSARGTLSTSTFLKDDDLAAGDGQIAKIFGVLASMRWADGGVFGGFDTSSFAVDVRHYNISALPFRAGGVG